MCERELPYVLTNCQQTLSSEVQNGGKEKRGAAKLNESKLAQINNGAMIVGS